MELVRSTHSARAQVDAVCLGPDFSKSRLDSVHHSRTSTRMSYSQ